MAELWQMMGTMEKVLLLISILVLIASLLGMSTMLLASMRERLREMAVLRAIGASPWFIFLLIELEALLITLLAVGAALISLRLAIGWSQTWLSENYGLFVSTNIWTSEVLSLLAIILAAASAMALLPALAAYRSSLHVGLSSRT